MTSDPSTSAEHTVTDLEPQKNNTERFSVFIDGSFAFGLAQEVVLKYNISVGDTLDPQEQQRLEEEDRKIQAKQTALNYLTYKPRTRAQVQRRLRQDDYSEGTIAEIIERFEEVGYIDDEAYVRMYIEERFEGRGYGPYRIRKDLRKRGVESGLIDEAMDEIIDAQVLRSKARAQAEKRWDRLQSEDDPRRRRKKLHDYLARRGFPYDLIREVVDEVARG